MGISDVVVDNHLRDAVEEQREFLHPERVFGEGVRATSREGMFREIRMKLNCYNMLIVMVA